MFGKIELFPTGTFSRSHVFFYFLGEYFFKLCMKFIIVNQTSKCNHSTCNINLPCIMHILVPVINRFNPTTTSTLMDQLNVISEVEDVRLAQI